MKKLTRRQVLQFSGVAAGAILTGYGCTSKPVSPTPTPSIAPITTLIHLAALVMLAIALAACTPAATSVATPTDIPVQTPTLAAALTVTDIDGNVYRTVTIGTQTWLQENLKTTRYRNGDIISTTTPATLDYDSQSAPKYQWAYAGDESHVAVYGRLYTWYAATDPRNICPVGWHVPTNAEWTILYDFLGGAVAANGKLKETGTAHWKSPNADATNESGFTGLSAGSHWQNGEFSQIGEYGHYWAADLEAPGWAYRILLTWDLGDYPYRGSTDPKAGFPVRCVEDRD